MRTPDYTTSPYSLLLHTSLCEPLITLYHLIRCYFTPVCVNPWLHNSTLFFVTSHCEPLITLFHLIRCYFTPVCANPWLHFITLFVVTSQQLVRTPDYTTSPYSLILDTSLGGPLIALPHLLRWYLTPRHAVTLITGSSELLMKPLHLVRWYLTRLCAPSVGT